MKTMKFVRLVLAVAGVLMAGGLAGAQGPGAGQGFGEHRPPMERAFGQVGGAGQWWNNPNVAKQLNLTDDQRKAMDGILQDHRMKLIDLHANLERAEVTLGPMMKADTPDRAAIESQIDKVVQARADLERANSRFLLDLRMQLKPEQWEQLRTMRQNRMAGDRGREWQRGGPRPGGGQFRGRQMPPPSGEAPQAPAPPATGGPSGAGTGEQQ